MPASIRSRALLLGLGLLMPLVACDGAPEQTRQRVLAFQDGSVPDARSVVSPAVLGLGVALDGSGLGLEVVDVGGGPDVAVRAATNPEGVVAAVVAPFTRLPSEARDLLLGAGVPLLSLSWLDEAGPPGSGWRRLVDPIGIQAEALARTAGDLAFGGGACVVGEASLPSTALSDALMKTRGGSGLVLLGGAPEEAARAALDEGCAVLVWTGSAPGALNIRRVLGEGGPTLIVGDAARTDGFLESGWPGAAGTIGLCSCADLSTSADPDDQAFLHAYQEGTGLDAGPFAVEGWDAGRMVLEGLPDRFEGVARGYTWAAGGDPSTPSIRIYWATGVRWLEQPTVGLP